MQIKIEALVQDRMRIEYMAGSPEQAALFLNWVDKVGFPSAAPAAVVEAAPAPAVVEEEITLPMCSQLAVSVVNAKGRDAFNAVMAKFGVSRLGELKQEDIPAAYKALQEVANG
jgi:hypothetical protein